MMLLFLLVTLIVTKSKRSVKESATMQLMILNVFRFIANTSELEVDEAGSIVTGAPNAKEQDAANRNGDYEPTGPSILFEKNVADGNALTLANVGKKKNSQGDDQNVEIESVQTASEHRAVKKDPNVVDTQNAGKNGKCVRDGICSEENPGNAYESEGYQHAQTFMGEGFAVDAQQSNNFITHRF